MRANIPVLTLLILSIISPIISTSSAQSVLAEVDLVCSSPNPSGVVEIEVYPGATLTGFANCTVSNPTVHVEKVDIQISADGLAISSPGSITVDPGAEVDFQVTVRADSRMAASTRTLSVTATVQEISGVPPPNSASSEYNMIISIMQFARLDLEMVDPIQIIEVGGQSNLQYKAYNQGNNFDKFRFSIEFERVDNSQVTLPMASMELESMGPPSLFRVNVVAPTSGTNWPMNSEGMHTFEMNIHVTVESDFSCRQGNCISTTVIQKVIFYQNQTIEEEPESNMLSDSMNDQLLIYGGSGGVVILLLILFLIMRRK